MSALPSRCRECGERGRLGSTAFCGVCWKAKKAPPTLNDVVGRTPPTGKGVSSRLEGAQAVVTKVTSKGGGSRPERLTRETPERAMPQTVGGAMSPGGRTRLTAGKRVVNPQTGEVIERAEGHGPKCTCLYHRQQRA